MPTLIDEPVVIAAAGDPPKRIEEYIGRVRSGERAQHRAHGESGRWSEPGQTPEFDEYTLVLRGTLRVKSRGQPIDVSAGQAVIAHQGEWVQYSTPLPGGAEYVAVCAPAFAPAIVHRDAT
jgi:mannose-6-phosphate isomerase-like protein (cupin superfamily)